MADKALAQSELERFQRNLDNYAKTAPGEAQHFRFQGILESQVVTLQLCGIITDSKAVQLHTRIAEVTKLCRADSPAGEQAEKL